MLLSSPQHPLTRDIESSSPEEPAHLIHTILGQIKVGVAPPIQLPASLLSSVKMEIDAPSNRKPANDKRSPEKRVDKDKADKTKERMEKPYKKQVMKEDWSLTKRKTYGKFFNKKKYPEMSRAGPSSSTKSKNEEARPSACVIKAPDCANGDALLHTSSHRPSPSRSRMPSPSASTKSSNDD